MNGASIFRPERIPSLSRLPKEIGRQERFCERCSKATEHIIYVVPRKVAVFLYTRDHPENVHATCVECARSVILRGEEREQALGRSE
ncbi:hypothetical protein [Rubrobacter calidifluminis]|uniref:hypothetical protein n=1 Tax=Rubrobacter calidifluminis TaxID=1392640 RepID=UPI002362C487|nr:hypothetical protein [Rubrobacter calidifluminis]